VPVIPTTAGSIKYEHCSLGWTGTKVRHSLQKQPEQKGAVGVTQAIECLLSKPRVQMSNTSTTKKNVMIIAYKGLDEDFL
jgi:hypothetical protein